MSTTSNESLGRDPMVPKHQHSVSESGRLHIPMWDSSDPDRAPPPLPLNPGTSSPITKPNTSSRIEEAAALITSKAREHAQTHYISKAMPNGSPEKSLIKGHHKRMQSMQSGGVRDLSSSLERRSPEKGLGRDSSLRTAKVSEYEGSPERKSREETPTPTGLDSPTRNYLNKPIIGETTPPSATMLALQNMRTHPERDGSQGNTMTHASIRQSQPSFDALSSQLLSLTSICTNLQREMAQLSRRSKDNATDLVSLKEATNSRDEDIRKSLKELTSNISERLLDQAHGVPGLGSFLLEDRAHNNVTPTRSKNFSLPRIPSPNSFSASIERELAATPSLVSSDGAASIALLEKVLREMGTKEGQEKIIKTLEELSKESSKSEQATWDSELTTKLDDIIKFMKDNSTSQALVKAHSGNNLDYASPHSAQMARVERGVTPQANEKPASASSTQVVSEELMAMLKRIKGSVAEGGGLTNEVKALVRELRGEVLGMGREIARKLEQAESSQVSTRDDTQGPGREEIAHIVEDGLAELRNYMDQVIRDKRQEPEITPRSPFDSQEIYHAVRSAMTEQITRLENSQPSSNFEKEEILQAVREAWEDCKPEIELQNFGLERDEILACLREGLQSYRPDDSIREVGASYDEVLDAVRRGLQDFRPPPIDNEASITREEILSTVRECLESFDFAAMQAAPRETDLSRDDVLDAVREGFATQPLPTELEVNRDEILDAVREGLATQSIPKEMEINREEILEAVREGLATQSIPREMEVSRDEILDAVREGLATQAPVTKEIEFNREDLFEAVKAGLEGAPSAMGDVGEQVLEQMHEFITSMKTEFKQYSAANGKDTEQVLDAIKDGLEELRAEIESYVDRAADVTGKDEIIDIVKNGFRSMHADMENGFANAPRAQPVDTPELLDAMEKEFNYLRETITKTMVQAGSPNDKAEILDAIRDIQESDRGSSLTVDTSNVATMVKEELEHLRETLAGMLVRQNVTIEREDIHEAVREAMDAHHLSRKEDGSESILSNTGELLDAFQEGVDGIRADMQKLADRPIDVSSGFEMLDEIKDSIQNVRNDIEKLHDSHRQVAEVSAAKDQELMTSDSSMISTEIEGLKVMITQLRIKVEALDSMPPPVPEPPMNSLTKDDLEDLANTLRDVQGGINDLSARDPPIADIGNAATKDDTEAIETLLRNAKAKLDELDPEKMATFEHIAAVDDVLAKIKETVDAHKESAVSKDEFATLEILIKDLAVAMEDLQTKITEKEAEPESEEEKVTKADIQVIETLCFDTKAQIDELKLPDPEILADKTDIETLADKIKSLQEQIEADNELAGQAFDARKTEHGGLATKIDDAKGLVSDLREELLKKLDGSEEGIVELAKTLENHNETFGTFATAAGLAEVIELLKESFEKTDGSHNATKLEVEERDAALMVKHEETKAALTKEIGDKLEEKFSELMIKYDDAQQASEASRTENTEAVTSTKTVVDDLKTLIDTLGTTITETCERMSDDATTVFNRVDETHGKVEELRDELKVTSQSEHNMTRDEIAKTVSAAERLEAQLHEQHPAVLNAIKDIENLVNQHFEHSQRASEEVKSTIFNIPSAIPPLLPAPEPSPPIVFPEHKEYDDTQVHEKLDELIGHASAAKEYDDTQVHQKLDELIGHASAAKESLDSMSKMDEIHQQVLSAAAEISNMVATQSRLMAEHHESKAQEAQEAAVALEKRTAQKEAVEADIVRLSQEREELAVSVLALKKDNEELAGQSKRLTREVGVLETALSLRQEEMKIMEKRAEALEKRILDGVMDHARSLMIGRTSALRPDLGTGSRKSREEKRDKAMSLKRVPSTASSVATTKASAVNKDKGTGAKTATRPATPSTLSSAVGLALKKRAPLQEGANSRPGSAQGRRILSTSHVTPRGSMMPDHRALMLAPASNSPSSGGLVNLKRSHSVKSNPSSYYGGRKASWGGRRTSTLANKENEVEVFREEDEEHHSDRDEDGSDAGTERRTSFTGTESDLYTVTDSMAYGTESTFDGSGMESSLGARTASIPASSTRGEVEGEIGEGGQYLGADEEEQEPEEDGLDDHESSINESDATGYEDHSEEDDEPLPTPSEQEEGEAKELLDGGHHDEEADKENSQLAITGAEHGALLEGDLQPPPNMKDLVMYQPSDSGIGSELPTATLSAMDGMGYFEGSGGGGGAGEGH